MWERGMDEVAGTVEEGEKAHTIKVWEQFLADGPCDLGVLAKDGHGNGRYRVHGG